MLSFLPKKQSAIYNRQSTSLGFTLIELLVVIVIISILAGLLMFNFVGVRQRGRDVQRKSDLRQIQVALELYRSDSGTYPLTANYPTCGSEFISGSITYMKKVPCDPLEMVGYSYTSDGATYEIYACVENSNDPERDSSTKGTCTALGTNYASYTLTNP